MTNEEKIILCTVHNNKEIKGFFGKYRFLSNFHICEIEFEGGKYPSVENAYQAAKTIDKEQRKKFEQISPNEAKSLGRRIALREDWEEMKIPIMSVLLVEKFKKNEDLKHDLLNTGIRELEETNWWGDTFWGVCDNKGENILGTLLMLVRSAIMEKSMVELQPLIEDKITKHVPNL